jgi:hypothetical protein
MYITEEEAVAKLSDPKKREVEELEFSSKLFVRGFVYEDGEFIITDMYFEMQRPGHRQRKGHGTKALLALKKFYGKVSVSQVTDRAEPFWQKMIDRGIVERINSYWDVTDDY